MFASFFKSFRAVISLYYYFDNYFRHFYIDKIAGGYLFKMTKKPLHTAKAFIFIFMKKVFLLQL